jgi:signal transduction histidine kinase
LTGNIGRGRADSVAMRGMRRSLITAAGALLAGQALAMLLPGEVFVVGVARETIPFIVPLVAAAAAFVAAAKAATDERPFWLFVAAGSLAWGLGDIGFSIYGMTGYDPAGKLSLADIGYLALIPLWGAALVVHPSRSRRAIDRLGTSVDALVVLSFAATLTTVYVLIPALREATDVSGAIVTTAYPLGDLALIAVLVSILARSAHRMRSGDVLVAVAAAVFAVGDIAFARLSLIGAYEVGNPVDLTWSVAFICVAVGAGKALATGQDDERRSTFPLLAVVGLGATLVLAVLALTTHLRDTALLIGAVITGLLVVLRLGLLLVDRARLIDTLDEKVLELEEAHNARDRFIATVSHDLRSPLTAIDGFAQLLQEPAIAANADQVVQMASTIERNSRHLTNLTEDLLCAGQFATGHPPQLQLVAVNLRRAISDVMSDLRRDNVVVEGNPFVHALADERRLRQVLTNLVDNAFKHSGSQDVRVRVGQSDDGPTIEVSDRGKGMTPERMGRIFEPFANDVSKASSVGLGLYVVANLVSAMRGRLSVTSEIGGGTTFTVTLPGAKASVVRASGAQAS